VTQYDASIRGADAAFGRLLDFLKRAGRSGDTVVAVAADHGESLGEHGLVGHNALHHGVLHTPLVVRVPGGGSGRSAEPAMNVDLVPTLLSLLGLFAPEPRRGRDLFGSAPGHAFQFAEYENARAVVVGERFKLRIRRGDRTSLELFDLVEDPAERARPPSPRGRTGPRSPGEGS